MKTTIQYPAIILHQTTEIETRQTHYVKGKRAGKVLAYRKNPGSIIPRTEGGREVRSKSIAGLCVCVCQNAGSTVLMRLKHHTFLLCWIQFLIRLCIFSQISQAHGRSCFHFLWPMNYQGYSLLFFFFWRKLWSRKWSFLFISPLLALIREVISFGEELRPCLYSEDCLVKTVF